MPTVTITHSDSSTEQIDNTVGWTWKREIGVMSKLTVTVDRDDAQSVTLDKKTDEVELAGTTTGRLVDVQRGGSTWKLIVYSFEWDANRHAPTAGGTRKQGDDAALMTDFINDVSEWTAGTISDLTGPMTFVFNHAQANEAMRRIEQNVPGELQWNADKSVDYLSRLGSDKSGSITLSASNGNIEGEIRVQDRGRDLDATHLRVIGAHEGEAQKFVNLVPSGDSGNYENEVTYSQPRWSDSSDTDWARWENKDVVKQDALEEEAAALGEELKETMLEVKATVYGEDLAVGDTVRVLKPDADIDRDMRIHRIKTVSDGTTTRDECLLSTRTVARSTEQDRLRDIQRFNVAFQGSAVWGTPSGGFQAVDSGGLNYLLPFFYPDVEYEHTAELNVRSLPYRAFSSGAAAGGDHSHLVGVTHPSHSHDVSDTSSQKDYSGSYSTGEDQIGGSTPVSTSFTGISTDNDVWVTITGTVGTSSNEPIAVFGRLEDGSTQEHEVGIDRTSDETFNISLAMGDSQRSSSTVGVEVEAVDTALNNISISNTEVSYVAVPQHTHDVNTTSTTELGTTISETSDASGDHTHPVDPGVTEFSGETASGCDVLVNGSEVATNIGTGEFETTVDLSGDLTRGAWNLVEVTSDSLGLIIGTMGITAYRQIGES